MPVRAEFRSPELRRVFGAYPSGVVAVAALVDGIPVGLAASSFTSVSLSPALVSVCIAHTSTTWPKIARMDQLGLSVMQAHHEQVCKQLSMPSGDRFAGVAWHASTDGAVLLDDPAAWFVCGIVQQITAGDHDIIVLRVDEMGVEANASPLVFHGSRFRRLAAAYDPQHAVLYDYGPIGVEEFGWP